MNDHLVETWAYLRRLAAEGRAALAEIKKTELQSEKSDWRSDLDGKGRNKMTEDQLDRIINLLRRIEEILLALVAQLKTERKP